MFLSLLNASVARAELQSGEVLSQANWQEAKGLLPEAVLRRFQDGSYQATVTSLSSPLSWGSKFTAASAANAGQFSVDAAGSLIANATHTFPPFLYGYPFPQIDPTDPQAAAKVMYNFSYTLMQADDAERFSSLYFVGPSAVQRQVEFRGQLLFHGSRASAPLPNPDATLRKGIIAGVAPAEVARVIILEWVHLDPQRWNSLWTYIPEFRKVRLAPPADGSESLFGSDLAHDDLYLFSGKVQYFTWKLLGVQEALVPSTLPNPKPLRRGERGYLLEMPTDLLGMGWEQKGWTGKAWWPTKCQLVKRPVWVVEATAKDAEYAYSRQVLWIDQELSIAYYKEAYNRAGQLWRMLLSAVTVVRTPEGDFSLAQPDFTLSVDEQQNRATLEMPSPTHPLTFGVGLRDAEFTPVSLMQQGR